MSRWTTTFGRWVQSYGVAKLRDDLIAKGELVTTSAIYAWIAGRAVPQPAKADIIVELAKGKLTWQDIYNQRKQANTDEQLVQERPGIVAVAPSPARI